MMETENIVCCHGFFEIMETEQRTLHVVSVCGNDGNRTESLHVVSGCRNDLNGARNIACCAVPLNLFSFQISFVFIPAMLIRIIDFYHFMPVSLALTLAGDHKISAKQNLLASFSPALFIWSGWTLMWCWSSSSWTSWDYFWIRFIETRERTAVLLTAYKIWHWHAFQSLGTDLIQSLGIDLIQTCHGGAYILPYILILVSLTLTLTESNRSGRMQKLLLQLPHKVVNGFEWNLMYWWDLLCISYRFYVDHSIFKRDSLTYIVMLRKLWLVFRHYSSVSFTLDLAVETTILYILISVWMTWTCIQCYSCVKKHPVSIFSQIEVMVEIQYVATTAQQVCWCYCLIYFTQVLFGEEISADMIWWNICWSMSHVQTLVNCFVSNLVWC